MRFLTTMCSVTALVVTTMGQPAMGAPTAAEKCASAKISATGKYSLCRLQAEARAEKTGKLIGFNKCSAKHTDAFGKAEAKYGAECPTIGDASAIQVDVGVDVSQLACRSRALAAVEAVPPCLAFLPAGAAIVSVGGIKVTNFYDPILTVSNTSATDITAYCFFVENDANCNSRDFFLPLPAQSTVSWFAGVGLLNQQSRLPPTSVPFSGEMVCLQIAAPAEFPVPVYANNLRATVTPPGGCTRDGISIGLGDGNNGDSTLQLGGGGQSEYGPCPASIGAAHIQSCWSNGLFMFECH